MKITLELLGGLELISKNHAQKFDAEITTDDLTKIPQLVCDSYIERQKELFLTPDGRLADGILFLVNDTDVELLDDKKLQNGDRLTFISMIHGG